MNLFLLLTIDTVNNVSRFLSLLLIFLFVLAITYFTTRYIANFQKGRMAHGNIKLIDSARLSQDKSIQIVQIGSRYVAIAISKSGVTKLMELDESELNLDLNGTELPGFTDLLKKAKDKMSNTQSLDAAEKESGKDDSDEIQ